MGDPDHRKEAIIARLQEISTRSLGLQIPLGVVPQVPLPDPQGGCGQEHAGDHPRAVLAEGFGDSGGQCAGGPHPPGAVDSAQVFGIARGGVSQRQERHCDLRPVRWAQAPVLGQALLGSRILCGHGGAQRRADPQVREVAN